MTEPATSASGQGPSQARGQAKKRVMLAPAATGGGPVNPIASPVNPPAAPVPGASPQPGAGTGVPPVDPAPAPVNPAAPAAGARPNRDWRAARLFYIAKPKRGRHATRRRGRRRERARRWGAPGGRN